MQPYSRHIVIDADFDRVVVDLLQAFQDQGLEIVSRLDLREHFKRTMGRDFRRHMAFEVWSPELAIEATRQDLEAGMSLMTRFVIYELADGETVVAATEDFAVRTDPAFRRQHVRLAALAHRQQARAARVLTRLRASHPATAAAVSAA